AVGQNKSVSVLGYHGNTSGAQQCRHFRFRPIPGNLPPTGCSGFLLQCHQIFQEAPRYYHSDHSKITLVINSLRNKALQWAQAFLAVNPISHLTYEHFLGEFQLGGYWQEDDEEGTLISVCDI
uniref:DUF4939 domain-containing protein n=1 Tax=Oryzias latipes TaxID=8090 RepID=A0A3B3IM72_ORYLA